jgi:hypothetical protein
MPPGVRWWLEHGCPLGSKQAEALGCFEDPTRAAWHASNLAFDRPSRNWTRRDLRELGFDQVIDEHIATGRCAPDRR